MGRRGGWIALAVAGGLIMPAPVLAAPGAWQGTEIVAGRLIAAVEGVGDRSTVPLGVELRLDPGWKTYWRSPGDAGLPPTLTWTGSENLQTATVAFPSPHRFSQFGLETVGYDTEVVFPITVALIEPGRPLSAQLGLDLLVCKEICVPRRLDLALAVPTGPAAPSAEAALIARSIARVPGDGSLSGLDLPEVRAAGSEARPALAVTVAAREPLIAPDLFVETDPPLAFGAATVEYDRSGRRATLRVEVEAAAWSSVTSLAGRSVTVTVVDGDRSLERTVIVAPAVAAPPAATPAQDRTLAGGPGWLAILATALLGGLVLNLMPCVLPVLSLKLFYLVRHGGGAPAAIRAGFLASAAGILVSFLVLAAILVGLRAGGAAIGWGIQFQQPLFLVLMVVLVTLFACNLWGWFEVALPHQITSRLGGGDHQSLAGHFAAGAFATVLATPCSAPFVGTAVGFALSRGPGEIFAVFAALGFGLALPYLIVAAAPRLAARMPRPGRWMLVLRAGLGGVLALTAVWLLTILAAQVGQTVATAIGGLMLANVALLWGRHRLPVETCPAAGAATGFAVAVLAGAAFAVPVLFDRPAAATSPGMALGGSDRQWTGFDPAVITAAVAQGQVVFVDVTADWCITCQANKRLVINRGALAQRLRDPAGTVLAMRADWTRPEPRIAAFLASFGRYGIPFNVVYGPGAPAGLILPELLTEDAVLAALDRAGGAARP